VSRSKLAESSSVRLLSLLLLAAMLVSGLKVSTTDYAATQCTWTGGHPPTSLSSPSNWVGNVAPAAGDDLFFPSGVRRTSIKNNFPNQTSFNSLNLSGSNYNLKKNSVTLTGGINTSNPTGALFEFSKQHPTRKKLPNEKGTNCLPETATNWFQ
jgi:hypothetical protein